jgi:hypothetical protein
MTPRFGALSHRCSERNTQPVQPRRLSFRDCPILDSKLSQAGRSSVLQKGVSNDYISKFLRHSLNNPPEMQGREV